MRVVPSEILLLENILKSARIGEVRLGKAEQAGRAQGYSNNSSVETAMRI
jgi:hypothetical protein